MKSLNLLFFGLFCLMLSSLSAQAEKSPEALTILFLGDSLTAGYGVNKDASYPQLVAQKFEQELKKPIEVLNGSVSGSTTASGLSRLRWFLKKRPAVLVLALGANDGLRGLSLKESQKNLEEIIQAAQAAEMKIVLAGMLMPANYGEDYRTSFTMMFKELTKKYNLYFIPFLLEGVATIPELNQADGIHPNEKGHEIMAQTVFNALKDIK